MFDFGILGNNARNLLYIKKFNDKKGIRLANNKLQTKDFLIERWIPFAKTYGIISDRSELYDFDFAYLPKKNFVVKPNHGSKGKWIYIVKYIEENPEEKNIEEKNHPKAYWIRKKRTNRIKKTCIQEFKWHMHTWWYQIGNETLTDGEFRRRLVDILDGKHSLMLGNDKIIVEEKLIPWELFKDFCAYGLADIRVIVFNLVPVATMIRVPTQESWGKANLAQWGIGLGIEVGSGKITSLLYKNKIYKTKFPKEFAHFHNKKIPYWNDILFLSSKVQYFVNLWYLALDRVITNEWPKLLEINARAGLEVQKVSNTKLQNVLDKIADLTITDPEKWVEIAKSLFNSEKSDLINTKLLYLSQYGRLIIKNKEEEEKIDTIVEVNLNKSGNYISQQLFDKIKRHQWKRHLDLYENDIIFKNKKFSIGESLWEHTIVLGNKIASQYLIKPINKTLDIIDIVNPKYINPLEKKELHTIDHKIEKLSKRLNLSSKLRPTNYFSELDKFITLHGKYNPIFTYKRPTEEKLIQTGQDIEKIQKQLQKFKSPFAKLFVEKLEELEYRRKLILAYTRQDFENIAIYNTKLFGEFDEKLMKIAKNKVLDRQEFGSQKNILGRPLKLSEIELEIEKHLVNKKIYGVDIVFSYDTLSRISVIMGKEIKINISKSAIFKEEGLRATLAHEIDTHLVRYLNWIKSGWHIFKSWTAYYQKDEEWFAIRNGNHVLPDDYEKISLYKKYVVTHELLKFSFSKAAEYLRFAYPERSLEGLFKTIIRSKRWLINTEKTWAGYMKDKSYLDWFSKIDKRLQEWNNPEKMYKGKIKIDDLDYVI